MAQPISRRNFIRYIAAAGLAALPGTVAAKEETILEVYVWKKMEGPYCSGGDLIERWCYMGCAGTYCWVEWCETRVVGSCD